MVPTQLRSNQLLEVASQHTIRYAGDFAPLVIERASGSYIYDASGRAILDFVSGQMCATLGHNHPSIIAAIKVSCRQSMHLFSC